MKPLLGNFIDIWRFLSGHTAIGGRVTVQIVVSGLTRLDLTKKVNIWLLKCSEAVESNLAKLEKTNTVIFQPKFSVLWLSPFNEIAEGSYRSYLVIS